jgi:hypothetical protein
MEHIINLTKMRSSLDNGAVSYFIATETSEVALNELLGKQISIRYLNEIHCVSCGAKIKKSYMQGYCYNCYITVPETEECVLNPEKCRAHLGVARNMEYSKTHCLIPHYVYLSLTSDIKVGVTRNTQIPTRWIDQGAEKAIIVARTPNRYTAGIIEVFLKAHFNDKTNWSKMLQGNYERAVNLVDEKARVAGILPGVMKGLVVPEDEVTELAYPVLTLPETLKSVDLATTPVVEGTLNAIKGQYLIIGNNAINIRRHTGYKVDLTY